MYEIKMERRKSDAELNDERLKETLNAKRIIVFLSEHPNGESWGKVYIESRDESCCEIGDKNLSEGVMFDIENMLRLWAFPELDELEMALAMNRVFYMLRDGTHLHPHERKDAS